MLVGWSERELLARTVLLGTRLTDQLMWKLGHSCESFQHLKWAYTKAGEGLFIREYSNSTGDNGFELQRGGFRWDIRKKFFTEDGEAVAQVKLDASSSEVFRARLDRIVQVPSPWQEHLSLDPVAWSGGLLRAFPIQIILWFDAKLSI